MANGVMVVAEYRDDKVRKITLELLWLGKRMAEDLGGQTTACLIGKGAEAMAAELGRFGAETSIMHTLHFMVLIQE